VTAATMAALSDILAGRGEHGPIPAGRASALVAAAVEHGVDALVWEQLNATPHAASVTAPLYPRVRAAAAREVFAEQELRAVLDAFERQGVHVLLTKGGALAYTVYDEPWLRPRADTDLLVHGDEIAAAGGVLEACGYTRSAAVSTGVHVSHQAAFERIDERGVRHVVDLHWKTVNPKVLADALDFDQLWPGAESAPALGPAARTPSAIDSLLLACLHRLAHHQGQERLVWLHDMRLLTRSFAAADWTRFARRAAARRIAAICLDGLAAASSHLGMELPPAIEAQLAAAGNSEPSRIYVERRVTRRDVLRSDLAHLGSWRERLTLVREHLLPSPAFMRHRYGPGSRWPLPALYLHRLLTGATRWVRS
jgi:hypothetical protein